MRKTLHVQAVLVALNNGHNYGLSIAGATGFASGTVYPILQRLEDSGWVVGEWETERPDDRPARRYYRLTALGEQQLEGTSQTYDPNVANGWRLDTLIAEVRSYRRDERQRHNELLDALTNLAENVRHSRGGLTRGDWLEIARILRDDDDPDEPIGEPV